MNRIKKRNMNMKNLKCKKSNAISRRGFISTSASALAGITIVPSHVIAGLGHTAPSDKLNLAGIGIGGMGTGNLARFAKTQNIVAICDCDWTNFTARTFSTYPNAVKYKDYRVMLDKQKDIDGVVVSTPDHTHAVISLEAIKRGKHVYCEKPLTLTVYEAQVLAKAARQYKVATQMGNSGQAGDGSRRLREMIWDGVIGPVREVHVWTNRPNDGIDNSVFPAPNSWYWSQGIDRPGDTPPVPAGLDWDLFIGPAPMRPYHSAYHPFKWRGWWDFGGGALADMGCHAFDPIFRALKLKYPTSVQAVSTLINKETLPLGSMVRYEFPAREGMPPVSLTWYDGGLRPLRFVELEDGDRMGSSGTIYVGDKGKILGNTIYPRSLRESYKRPEPYIPSSPGHQEEWINACKGGQPAGSNFDWAGPLTETVLLGTIPLRSELREKLNSQVLRFDAEKLCFSNIPEANNFFHYEYRKGWSL
jgi:predicted dehydrogenase